MDRQQRRVVRRVVSLLIAIMISLAIYGLDKNVRDFDKTATAPSATSAQTTVRANPATTTDDPASNELTKLAIKGRAPKTGYSRDQFGGGWTTTDGCDTRNIILRRDLTNVRLESDSCTVSSGVLIDPYTAKTISFVRGSQTSEAVQIDHIVALSDAWQTGAQELSSQARERFANDTSELIAVDGPTNQAKGDSDAASWLPPNVAFRCEYVSRQINVKRKYSLWITQAEHDAMAATLASCG